MMETEQLIVEDSVVRLTGLTGDYLAGHLPYLREILKADYRGNVRLNDLDCRYSLVAFTFPRSFDPAEVPADGLKFLWVSWEDLEVVA